MHLLVGLTVNQGVYVSCTPKEEAGPHLWGHL